MSKKTKRYLMLLVAVGILAVAAGGSGTFATFNAETANNGNFIQTGTLFLHDTPQGGSACTSESAPNNQNLGTGDTCQTIFTATLASGTTTTYYGVALNNAGTLNAGGISLYSNGCTPAASQTLSNGTINGNQTGTVTSINVTGLTYGINSGTQITAGSETFTTTAFAGPGSTSIAVSSHAITGTLANGTAITFKPSFGNGNLCSGLDIGIIETDATFAPGAAVGCAYGTPSGSTCSLTNAFTFNTIPSTQGSAAPLSLTATGGTGNTLSRLSAGGTRYFLIAVKPDASLDNTFQNKKASIDLVWHIDQA